ncbi:MAG TPA: hypothetical protein VJB35_06670 [Candidatus Nanoarchaeia archaeon]|nr:hypothetical protein [Candidatus Nanoarchaeia archaeon]
MSNTEMVLILAVKILSYVFIAGITGVLIWFLYLGFCGGHLQALWRVITAKKSKEIMDLDKSQGGQYDFSEEACKLSPKTEKVLEDLNMADPNKTKSRAKTFKMWFESFRK